MDFMKMFGLGASKVEVKHKPLTPEQVALNEKMNAFFLNDSERVADIYVPWILPEVFAEICAYHNYLDLTWGSRKFGRMMNSMVSMLDISRCHDLIDMDEFRRLTELSFWATLLYMIPIKKLYRQPGCEDQLMRDFATWMIKSGRLTGDEIAKVIDLVFDHADSEAGDLIMDCFFDAVAIENTMFGGKIPASLMRTHQGKNTVYTTYLLKSVANNRQPDWVFLLQQKIGVTGFAEPSVELLNESNDGF